MGFKDVCRKFFTAFNVIYALCIIVYFAFYGLLLGFDLQVDIFQRLRIWFLERIPEKTMLILFATTLLIFVPAVIKIIYSCKANANQLDEVTELNTELGKRIKNTQKKIKENYKKLEKIDVSVERQRKSAKKVYKAAMNLQYDFRYKIDNAGTLNKELHTIAKDNKHLKNSKTLQKKFDDYKKSLL